MLVQETLVTQMTIFVEKYGPQLGKFVQVEDVCFRPFFLNRRILPKNKSSGKPRQLMRLKMFREILSMADKTPVKFVPWTTIYRWLIHASDFLVNPAQ